MKTFLAIGGVFFALVVLYFGWGYSHSESYCFFSPGIDTEYAAGYSDQAFSQITTGMTVQVVQQKLGAPLYAQTNRQNGRLEWYYTLDGKCSWGDWAWLVRAVYLPTVESWSWSGESRMIDVPPNHALQRTRPSRHCCNPRVSWAGSLSLGR